MSLPSGPLCPVTLLLGGARSGKSRRAEALVEGQGGACIYIATARAGDAEMAARIELHKQRRGPRWRTIEEPLDLAGVLERHARADAGVLVDCLTLWLSNLMAEDADIRVESGQLVEALRRLSGPVVLVSNEVGLGVVPDNALARAFRDHAGRLHQQVAEVAQSVVFMAAGLPWVLKDPATS